MLKDVSKCCEMLFCDILLKKEFVVTLCWDGGMTGVVAWIPENPNCRVTVTLVAQNSREGSLCDAIQLVPNLSPGGSYALPCFYTSTLSKKGLLANRLVALGVLVSWKTLIL